MRWLKSDKWKAGIALVGMLLLLVLMVWVPVPEAGAYEGVSGLATPGTGTVQATPTEDATVTTLNKEKLAQEVQQLKNQNASDLFGWLRTNAAVLLSTLVVVIGGLIGLFRWLGDRRDEQEKRREDQRSEQEKRSEEQKRWLEDRQADRERRDQEQQRWLKDQEAEREKRAEERFQAVVEGLGSEREEAKVGAAITLRTFLRSGYEQFYTQALDLAVAHLRLPRGSVPLDGDLNNPLPLTTLSQALTVVFKEAFPLARSQNKESPESLDATNIQLDNAYLAVADLKQAWMPQASLRKADLSGADLSNATLFGATLRGADLFRANLSGAELFRADLSFATLSNATLRGANLFRANLSGSSLFRADLFRANLSEADLSGADLSNATISGADLSFANISNANISNANLSEADLSGADLRGANLESACSLEGTKLSGVKGLGKKQLAWCESKGAIVDKDSTTSSSQSTVSPSPLSPSNDAQALPTPSAQENAPAPDAGNSNAASS